MASSTLSRDYSNGKTPLQVAEEVMRHTLRNNFKSILNQCQSLDTMVTGSISKEDFHKVLGRGGVRLTNEEFEAVHNKYKIEQERGKRYIKPQDRPVDYFKFKKLFHDWFANNDLENPEILAKASSLKNEAADYMKAQLRNNYRRISNVFRALDIRSTGAIPYDVFQRLLSQYGGVRFTKDEWWGFTKMVDKDADGLISHEEFEAIFKDFDNGETAATMQQRGDATDAEEVERMLALRLAGKLAKAEKVLRINDQHRRGELTSMQFRRSVAQFGLILTDPELEALVRKFQSESGMVDYIRFIQSIGNVQKLFKRGQVIYKSEEPTASTLATGRKTGRKTARQTKQVNSSRLTSRSTHASKRELRSSRGKSRLANAGSSIGGTKQQMPEMTPRFWSQRQKK